MPCVRRRAPTRSAVIQPQLWVGSSSRQSWSARIDFSVPQSQRQTHRAVRLEMSRRRATRRPTRWSVRSMAAMLTRVLLPFSIAGGTVFPAVQLPHRTLGSRTRHPVTRFAEFLRRRPCSPSTGSGRRPLNSADAIDRCDDLDRQSVHLLGRGCRLMTPLEDRHPFAELRVNRGQHIEDCVHARIGHVPHRPSWPSM